MSLSLSLLASIILTGFPTGLEPKTVLGSNLTLERKATLPHQLQIETLQGRILIGQAWVLCPSLGQSQQPEEWGTRIGQPWVICLLLWSEGGDGFKKRVGRGLWRPNPQMPVDGTCPHPSPGCHLCPAMP